MPVKKHANRKNVPPEVMSNPVVPRKEESSKKNLEDKKLSPPLKKRVNALSTAGKKKKPK